MATETIFLGDTYDQRVTVVDQAGTAVDITGGTLILTVRDYVDAIMATDTSTTFSDPTNGVGEVGFTAAETGAFTLGVFNYDIQFTDAAAEVFTVITGIFQVSERETR